MHRFSWIITFIAVYFLSVLLYLFVTETIFWQNYFTYITLGSFIFVGLCVFEKHITEREKGGISFMIAYKAMNLVYLMISDIVVGNRKWLEKHIAFLVVIGVAGFLAWYFNRKKK